MASISPCLRLKLQLTKQTEAFYCIKWKSLTGFYSWKQLCFLEDFWSDQDYALLKWQTWDGKTVVKVRKVQPWKWLHGTPLFSRVSRIDSIGMAEQMQQERKIMNDESFWRLGNIYSLLKWQYGFHTFYPGLRSERSHGVSITFYA